MGMIGKALKKFNAIDPETGLSWADRLAAAGGVLGDDPTAAKDLRDTGAKRLEASRAQAYAQEMARRFSGGPQPMPQATGGIAPQPQGPPSMQELAPLFAQGLAEGQNVSPWMTLANGLQPKADSFIEGPNGIYKVSPGKEPELVTKYPEKPNTTPGRVNPDTGKWEWAPGYLESQGLLTEVRRKAVVANPMPSRGRAAGKSDGIKWD